MTTIHIETVSDYSKEFDNYLKRNNIEVVQSNEKPICGGIVYAYTGSKISILCMIEVYFDNILMNNN